MIKKFLLLIVFFIISIFIGLIILYSQIRFDVDKIVEYKPRLTTQFFDKNGVHLGNVFDKENRLYVKYEAIPPRVTEALVAIEDTNFFEHNGVNIDAILRAIIKDIKAMALVEGASTLTQQLVKTMILTRDKKIIRKIKEILLSLRLESLLTKEEILERYLNQVYFGHGYYGIKTAALGYFKKELDQLNLKEISMLVGLPRAPSFYDPTKNLKYALIRANQVIKRLKTLGWINQKEYDESINYIPIVYDTTLSQNKAPYIIDTAISELKDDVEDLKTGGYKINLTIDLEAQKIAKDALKYGYDRVLRRDKHRDTNKSTTQSLNGAIIVLENNSGAILSMVGGIDYKTSSFNRARQSIRQPGSSIKPFLYQVALNLGYSTASNIVDISRTYKYNSVDNEEKLWQPKNYEKNFKGLVTFRYALVHSRNLATINLVTDIGIDILHKELQRYGFKNIPYDLSITLGSFGISPLDLSKMFTLFSNQGIIVEPYIISSLTNRYGQKIIFEKEENYIMPAAQTYLMTSILKEVVDKGTGRNGRVKNLELVAKTGTTNNNVDAWFCGYSPSLQTIVWYGNDDNKPMGRRETGGRTAGPAFAYFYRHWMKLHPEIPRKFIQPKEVFIQKYNGKEEVFTPLSNVPKSETNMEMQTEHLKNKNILF
ncbi:penicillin-binding protein 1A [Arcobacter sp. 15-2]|uniref:transglycosylase domain-containing protein n=1 Tax=Arcobacter sp. 15-2 TaxID=3374109 RepID=UPI00399CC9AF